MNLGYETERTQLKKTNGRRLTFTMLQTLFLSKGLTVNPESFEENVGVKTANGRYNFMGELLADRNDVSIKATCFRGTDKTEVVRRKEFGNKCLFVAIEQMLNYVEALNDTNVYIGTHVREDVPLFDMASFREAWLNACVHTRWETMGPPAVYIYSDRLEIVSGGGLPPDLTQEEFYKGISKPVNDKLQKIFGQLGYVEQTGHGVPLIVRSYGPDAFEFSPNFLIVRIPFDQGFGIEEPNESRENVQKLNPAQSKILRLVSVNPRYTINDLMRSSGLSEGYVKKILRFLKAGAYIARVGAKRNGYWKTL